MRLRVKVMFFGSGFLACMAFFLCIFGQIKGLIAGIGAGMYWLLGEVLLAADVPSDDKGE